MESNGNLLKVLLLALVVVALFKFDATKSLVTRLIPGGSATEEPTPATSPAESPTPPPSVAALQAQSLVKAYMLKYAAPQSSFLFLNWSDFSSAGPNSTITLRYRVSQPGRRDALAWVRFTIHGGAVTRTEVVQPAPPAAAIAAGSPTPAPVVVDRFSAPIAAAVHGLPMTLHLTDAYSLAQLDAAKQRAQAEQKPIGFIMVWGQFFDHPAEPRSEYSDSALVHFYEVFNQELVLVFVRHETELGLVPPVVQRGFQGPNEGGYSPNMAVTDASATDFIVEIPYRNRDGAGRDQLFADGGKVIDQWLATHPNAMVTPSPSPVP